MHFRDSSGTAAAPAVARLSTRTSPVLSSHLFAELVIARAEAAECIDLLLERESTVEDEAARADKPALLMRLFFIDSQLKLVPWNRVIVDTYSPILRLRSIDSLSFYPNSISNTVQKDRQAQTLAAVLSIPGINAGAFRTIRVKWLAAIAPSPLWICLRAVPALAREH
jgi:hypothetical protein